VPRSCGRSDFHAGKSHCGGEAFGEHVPDCDQRGGRAENHSQAGHRWLSRDTGRCAKNEVGADVEAIPYATPRRTPMPIDAILALPAHTPVYPSALPPDAEVGARVDERGFEQPTAAHAPRGAQVHDRIADQRPGPWKVAPPPRPTRYTGTPSRSERRAGRRYRAAPER
jgi:hypothetical protein